LHRRDSDWRSGENCGQENQVGNQKKGLSYIEKWPKGKEKISVHKLEREDHIGYISRGQALAVL